MITRQVYDKIIREYDARRTAAEQAVRARQEALYLEIPALRQVDDEMASASVQAAISRLHGGADSEYFAGQLANLRAVKQQLLTNAGYSPSDLEPSYSCPLCKDTGYVNGAMCDCFKKKIVNELYAQSGISDILKEENFSNYSFKYYSNDPIAKGSADSPLTIAQRAVRAARSFIEHFDTSAENMLICGATGTGKTFLANCIAAELIDSGHFVIYLSAFRLFEVLADATFRSGGASYEDAARFIYDCDLLIIDDLGVEMVNSFVNTQLFNCINERLTNGRHTIISTNLSVDQLQANYSERVVSRILNKYTLIKLYGEDIRVKKKLED